MQTETYIQARLHFLFLTFALSKLLYAQLATLFYALYASLAPIP
jgi:hypothetical protein